MFADLKIGTKQGLGYGIAMLILVGVGGFASHAFYRLEEQWTNFDANINVKKDLLAEGHRALGDGIHHVKNFALRGGDYDQRFAADTSAYLQTQMRFFTVN